LEKSVGKPQVVKTQPKSKSVLSSTDNKITNPVAASNKPVELKKKARWQRQITNNTMNHPGLQFICPVPNFESIQTINFLCTEDDGEYLASSNIVLNQNIQSKLMTAQEFYGLWATGFAEMREQWPCPW